MNLPSFLLTGGIALLLTGAGVNTVAAQEQAPATEQVAPPERAPRGERPRLTPEQRVERQTARLTEELSLTEDQAARLKAVNLEFAEKRHAMREVAREERRAEAEGMRAKHDAAVKGILTAEQFANYEKLMDERASKRKGRRGGKGHHGRK